MGLKSNLEYWQISLGHPEPVGDDFYRSDVIIVESEDYLAAATRLRELITTYCSLREIDVSTDVIERVVAAIDDILKNTKNIQYTEFVAYWKCLDMTFSDYTKQFDAQRIKTLTEALDKYCAQRRRLYERFGYSHVVQQALYDSARARSQGATGVQKLQSLLQQEGITEVRTIEDFPEKPFCQLIPSRGSQSSFAQLIRHLKAKYSFGETHQRKIPDLVVKLGTFVLIIEAKHIKEPGGAQDKQIKELIEYISNQESEDSPVSYVAFLDGFYFNILANAEGDNKPFKQRCDIEKALQGNPRNYFVNTEGFVHLIRDMHALAQSHATPALQP